MNQDRAIRRLQVALYSRGEGVILFSLWNSIEVILLLLSSSLLLDGTGNIPSYSDPVVQRILYIIFSVFLALVVGGNLALNIYIGRAAIGFSHGKPVRTAPLIWAGLYSGIYLCLTVFGLVFSLKNGSFLVNLISCVLDIFVLMIHVQIIVFSHRLKKAGL